MFHSRNWRKALPFPLRGHRGHGHDHDPQHSHGDGSDHAPVALDSTREVAGYVPADKVQVMAAIYAENDRLAQATQDRLTRSGILSVNVMGAPGVGKTSTIIALTEHLPDWHHYVVEGDIESDIDTQTLRQLGVKTLQINTHGACHLESHQIDRALAEFDFRGPGLMLIENIGNLVCPAEMVIGEHIKLLIVTTTDGSDKPYKYPLAFEKADLILLNKADLLPYVDFDLAFFMAGVRALNPTVPVLQVSARSRTGFEPVAAWLRQRADLLLRDMA